MDILPNKGAACDPLYSFLVSFDFDLLPSSCIREEAYFIYSFTHLSLFTSEQTDNSLVLSCSRRIERKTTQHEDIDMNRKCLYNEAVRGRAHSPPHLLSSPLIACSRLLKDKHKIREGNRAEGMEKRSKSKKWMRIEGTDMDRVIESGRRDGRLTQQDFDVWHPRD